MEFSAPYFLFGLFILVVPIIIHLFNFKRYKEVYFSDIRFLKEVKQETNSKRKIKNWLILFSRLLALLFIILAFSQPYTNNDKSVKLYQNNRVSIYIDNSLSMQSVNKEGNLLEQAKNIALKIIDSYNNDDQINILTNNSNIVYGRFYNKEDIKNIIEGVSYTPSVISISNIISKQEQLLNSSNTNCNRIIYLLSDFQKNNFDFNNLKIDSNLIIKAITLENDETYNLYIDSCWFIKPYHNINSPEKLFVKIKNLSDENLNNVPVKLIVNGVQKAANSLNISSNSSEVFAFDFFNNSHGIQQLEVKIEDAFIKFDDSYYLSYQISKGINVLDLVEDNYSNVFKTLFENDSSFIYNQQNIGQLNYSLISNQDLIILNAISSYSSGIYSQLENFINSGGNLLIIPPIRYKESNINEFLNSLKIPIVSGIENDSLVVNEFDYSDELFQNIFESNPKKIIYPTIGSNFKFEENKFLYSKLISSSSGIPILIRSSNRGNVYQLFVPIENENLNFYKHPLIISSILNMSFLGNKESVYNIYIRNKMRLLIDNEYLNSEVVRLKNTNIEVDLIPEIVTQNNKNYLNFYDYPNQSGNYFLESNNENIISIAFNYDRSESNLEMIDVEDYKLLNELGIVTIDANQIKNNSKNIENDNITSYWRVCLLFSLLFFIIETLLLRFL